MQEADSYHARNIFKWKDSLRPIAFDCTCVSERNAVYKKFIGDLSRRAQVTLASLLDSADVEFVMILEKYKRTYTFTTPPEDRDAPNFCVSVTPKFGENLPPYKIPIIMSSRLYRYSVDNPSTEVCLKKFLETEVVIKCEICHKDIEEPIPNSFKIGKLLVSPTACILKEKRKPFLNQSDELVYYTSMKMEEGNTEAIPPEKRQCFERWCEHKHELFKYGVWSFKGTGETFILNARNGLSSCYKKDASTYHYKTHQKRFTDDIASGNITGAYGKILFKVVSEHSDIAGDHATKIAFNTKQKSNGFLRLSSSYLTAPQSWRFICMKMIPQHSKDVEVRKIDESELGVIAIPDTTDGGNCGLKLEIVPGTRISNRTTCSVEILKEFERLFRPDPSSSSVLYLGGDDCEEIRLEGVTILAVFETVMSLKAEFDFDFEMVPHETGDFVGVLFSYHGIPIEYTTNLSICTIEWLKRNKLLPHYEPNLLSIAGNFICFFNFNNNSKVVGYLKSKAQEIDSYWHPGAQRLLSQSHKIVLTYPQVNLLNKYDGLVGQTVLVGIGCWNGMNVEESILVARGAVERGLFMTSEVRRLPFIFQRTNLSTIHLFNVCDSPLENDSLMFEIVGVDIYDQYSASVKVERRENGFAFYYHDDFEGKKWRIISYETSEGNGYVRVILEILTVNYCNEGVKLSTVHGQKGIVNSLVDDVDMPFLSNGSVLDVLINTTMIKRLTIGQLLQGIATTEVCKTGSLVRLYCGEKLLTDQTITEDLRPEMEDIFDPHSGELLNTVEVHYIYYRRFRQEGDQTAQCTSLIEANDKRDLNTSQFQKGKANKGGATFGGMEVKNIHATGSRSLMFDMNVHPSGRFEHNNDPLMGVLTKTAASCNSILMPLGHKFQFS